MNENKKIHAILARLPRNNELLRLAKLTGWERYELEYAQLAVLDGRNVSLGTLATLEELADRLEREDVSNPETKTVSDRKETQ